MAMANTDVEPNTRKTSSPGPGTYAVNTSFNATQVKGAPMPSFGGNLANFDRDKTGIRAEALARKDMPAPDLYSWSAAEQQKKLTSSQGAPRFGTSNRDSAEKVFLGKDMPVGLGRGSPGPGAYRVVAGGGGGGGRGERAAPAFSFGQRVSNQSPENLRIRAQTPGPGAYQGAAASTLARGGGGGGGGGGEPSGFRAAPRLKFSQADRFRGPRVRTQSEDGHLATSMISSMSRQQLSTRQSMPAFSFGCKDRSEMVLNKAGLPLRRARPGTSGGGGSDDGPPGPASYQGAVGPFTRSPESRTRSPPAYSFGDSSDRFRLADRGLPGLGAPGPALDPVPAVARQVESRLRSAPSISFGTDSMRLVERQTHQSKKEARPGPGAYPSSDPALGGRRTRAPAYSFGGGTREGAARAFVSRRDAGPVGDPNLAGAAARGEGPGPGAYADAHARAKQNAAQSFSFGARPSADAGGQGRPGTTADVGPGRYRPHPALGNQALSTLISSPQFSMGTSTRDKSGRVSRPGYKAQSVTKTPGPGSYTAVSSLGKQVESPVRSPPAAGFGVGPRAPLGRDLGVPGPGSYPGAAAAAATRHVSSRSRSPPAFSFGGGGARPPLVAGDGR